MPKSPTPTNISSNKISLLASPNSLKHQWWHQLSDRFIFNLIHFPSASLSPTRCVVAVVVLCRFRNSFAIVSCLRSLRIAGDIEKVFSFLSQDEVEKLKQEEEKKIATLKRDKKHKGMLRASGGNNLEDGASDGDDTDSSDDSENDDGNGNGRGAANNTDDHLDGSDMLRDKSKSAR